MPFDGTWPPEPRPERAAPLLGLFEAIVCAVALLVVAGILIGLAGTVYVTARFVWAVL